MPSAGLLFLLLVSSSLLVSARADPPENKQKEASKRAVSLDILLSQAGAVGGIVASFVALANPAGPIVAAAIVAATAATSIGHYIKTQLEESNKVFNELENIKLDLIEFKVDQKWETWATVYQRTERKINTAWREFKTTLYSIAGKKNEQKESAADEKTQKKQKEHFKEFYLQHESDASDLFDFVTAEGSGFMTNFEDLLVNHVRCHEEDINRFADLISSLMFKAHLMNIFYYKLKGILSEARVAEQTEMFYGVISVMYRIRKYSCRSILVHLERDVRDFIDKSSSKKRQNLADDVRSSLENAHTKYDWMVLAFKTKGFRYLFKEFNSDNLPGFTTVVKEDIAVAVAGQMKGKHSQANVIGQIINKCLGTVMCHNVENKLRKCEDLVFSKSSESLPMNQVYTAVDAYTRRSKSSTTATAEDGEDDFSASLGLHSAYIHTGTCNKHFLKGEFTVMIKSDEELQFAIASCSKVECGESKGRGKCVNKVCQCNKPYFGLNCEKSLEDYISFLHVIAEQLAM